MLDNSNNHLANHQLYNQPCWWMLAGVVDYKLCDLDFDCEHCPFDLILQTGAPNSSTTKETIRNDSQFGLLDTIFYHPNHVWLRVEDRGNVRIGLDDFAQNIMGRAYAVSLPHEGIKLTKGRYCWSVAQKAGETPLITPVSGVVIEVNWKLPQCPSLLNRDPYGAGWAFVIKPDDLKTGLRDLVYGSSAIDWHRAEMEKLYSIAGELLNTSKVAGAVTLPDGGSFKKDVLSELSTEQMRKLVSSFLPGPKVEKSSSHRHFAKLSSKRR